MVKVSTPQDAPLKPKAIAAYLASEQAHLNLDNAAQSAIVSFIQPQHDIAKQKLRDVFDVEDPNQAMKSLYDFYVQLKAKLPKAATRHGEKLSRDKVHGFFSLIYHLIDQGDSLREFRDPMPQSVKLLGLPKLSGIDEVKAHIAEIVTETNPAFVKKIARA